MVLGNSVFYLRKGDYKLSGIKDCPGLGAGYCASRLKIDLQPYCPTVGQVGVKTARL